MKKNKKYIGPVTALLRRVFAEKRASNNKKEPRQPLKRQESKNCIKYPWGIRCKQSTNLRTLYKSIFNR